MDRHVGSATSLLLITPQYRQWVLKLSLFLSSSINLLYISYLILNTTTLYPNQMTDGCNPIDNFSSSVTDVTERDGPQRILNATKERAAIKTLWFYWRSLKCHLRLHTWIIAIQCSLYKVGNSAMSAIKFIGQNQSFYSIFENTYKDTSPQSRATGPDSRFEGLGFNGAGSPMHFVAETFEHWPVWSIAVLIDESSIWRTLESLLIYPDIWIVAVPWSVVPSESVTNWKLWGDPESQPILSHSGSIYFAWNVVASWSPMSN